MVSLFLFITLCGCVKNKVSDWWVDQEIETEKDDAL